MTRETRSWSRIQRSASGTLVVGFFALLGLTPDLSAQSQASVTFARDVAPILQQKCEACHRDGSIDPMPLTNYEEVRPWAPDDQGKGGEPRDATVAHRSNDRHTAL